MESRLEHTRAHISCDRCGVLVVLADDGTDGAAGGLGGASVCGVGLLAGAPDRLSAVFDSRRNLAASFTVWRPRVSLESVFRVLDGPRGGNFVPCFLASHTLTGCRRHRGADVRGVALALVAGDARRGLCAEHVLCCAANSAG